MIKADKEESFGCVGSSIVLRSGRYIDLLNPKPSDIRIEDIAAALAKLCRFGGHCSRFYSVAEHSIHAASIVKDDGAERLAILATLLHDAAEAYIGDVVRPLKRVLGERVRQIEERILAVVSDRFLVDVMAYKPVWEPVDNALLIAERNALFPSRMSGDPVWHLEDRVRKVRLFSFGYSSEKSEKAFLDFFDSLSGSVS
jgi:hypothetical protein